MSRFNLPEPHDFYDSYSDRAETVLSELPECSECGYKIQDDFYYKVGNEIICSECIGRMKVYI